jgi:peroxiredoxin
MSSTVYYYLWLLVEGTLLLTIGMAASSLVFMLVRWRTPGRHRYAVRLGCTLTAVPWLLAAQQLVLWKGYIPSLGSEQRAGREVVRAKLYEESTLIKVGDKVPRFTLTTIDDQLVSLPQPGKVVLINFFATWCGPCLQELPYLERLWLEFGKDANFQLVVVGRQETVESLRLFRQQQPFSFPLAADLGGEVFSLFARKSIPRTLLVSPEGQVVYSRLGFYDSDVEALDTALRTQLDRLYPRP